ncbi:DUF3307 domain-containing protein [Alkaliphilus serpentinus]|uniref:DUF3307 domain-containing protein n=1 Tax=Alkaliphilus serpentinus TaxID=1482731 RepID=A0A833HM45_9FIRM|nr:DUF3307 domain-containing protein [Alkaliphilus serpentinus]KAB3525718.1 DUF3307 domain-containing protein [Alkaliphilus serpentinus]
MYTSLIIGLLFLSHIIADFYLQTDEMAKEKIFNKKVLLQHAVHHCLTTFILTIIFFSFNFFFFIVILSILHYWIDRLKTHLQKKYNKFSIRFFLFDQLFHITTLFLIIPYNELVKNIDFNEYYLNILEWFIKYVPALGKFNNDKWTIVLLLIAFYLFCINGGTVVTNLFLKKSPTRQELLAEKINQIEKEREEEIYLDARLEQAATITDNSKSNILDMSKLTSVIRETLSSMREGLFNSKTYTGGEMIGIIERLLIFSFIILGTYVSITFVLAAKSIARLKKIEQDSEFSDKFLIGTLSSAMVAIFCGVMFNLIKGLL